MWQPFWKCCTAYIAKNLFFKERIIGIGIGIGIRLLLHPRRAD